MSTPQRPDLLGPGDYLRALRRRWWIWLGLLVVGGAAAAAYVKLAPKAYTSTASVYVTATGADSSQAQSVQGGPTAGSVNMDSEAQIVQSMSVATVATRILHTSIPPAKLGKQVAVTVPVNSQILQITCSESKPGSAAACAQAFARAYLQNRSAASISQLRATLNTLRSQVTTLQRRVAGLTTKISVLPPNSTAQATAQAQLKSDDSQLNSLSNQVGVLTAEEDNSSGGQMITNAVPPSSPSSPRKLLVLPSGVAVGLLLGLVLAFVVDRCDRRIRGPRDVERHLDLPVLLTVGKNRNGLLSGIAAPRSKTGQAFAELAYMTAAALGDGNHVVVVTTASSGQGASVTAANLAAAFTRTHSQVVLVGADVQTSVVPNLFHLSQGAGLAEVLAGTATLGTAMQKPADFPRLRVLAPGADTANLLYDFLHDVTQQLFSDLRRSTPIVIIEVPAAGDDGYAFRLAEYADAALVVVEAGKTSWPETKDCVQRIARLRTMVLGVVLIPPPGSLEYTRSAEWQVRPALQPSNPPAAKQNAGEAPARPAAAAGGLEWQVRPAPQPSNPPAAKQNAGEAPARPAAAAGGHPAIQHPSGAGREPADKNAGS